MLFIMRNEYLIKKYNCDNEINHDILVKNK